MEGTRVAPRGGAAAESEGAPFFLTVNGVIEILVVIVPSFLVLFAAFKQSKFVAALAQLSSAQERSQHREALASKAIQVDQRWFMMGVSNVMASSYILGAWPTGYFLFYTPKVVSLIALRLATFYQKKQHFLLWDFCYWANFLCLYYCWVQPGNPWLFRIVFICANGPLAWSVLAFSHAMIFHSSAHVTSVVVHTSPVMLTYGLRWYASPVVADPLIRQFMVCDGGSAAGCSSVPFLTLVFDALSGFYLWWLVIYYLFIFIALGRYIEERGYQTLWDRILVMKPVGPVLKRMLQKFPKVLVQLVYLLIHLLFSTATMCVAALLWYNQIAHFCFVGAIVFSTVKNASVFYFEIFEQHYQSIVAGDSQSMSKKISVASPAFGLAQPLGCS